MPTPPQLIVLRSDPRCAVLAPSPEVSIDLADGEVLLRVVKLGEQLWSILY